MNTLLLVAALVVLVVALVGVIFLVRRFTATAAKRREGEAGGREGATTIIDLQTREQDGNTIAEPPRPWYRRLGAGPGGAPAAILLGLLLLIGLGAVLVFSGVFTPTSERFVVLVAPFEDGDGGTGRNVAEDLAREIEAASRGTITADLTVRSPTTPEEALALAAEAEADLLIWGSVEPGAMLDSPSLSPRLIYTPTGVYGPNGWDGYLGRFAMPRSFTLAREPINGRAVVVPLVLALADYARGAPDVAFEQLGVLLENYPGLAAPLPRAIRGNVLWARTFYSDAAAEYRLALAEPADEQALLANNLGAILLDGGDSATLSAFQEAVNRLEGRDLGELRYNLAVLALREGRNADAVESLEQARNLMPASVPMLLDLARAYRETGRLAPAAEALATARRQLPLDVRAAPPPYQAMIGQRYDAALVEQQALLDLARQLGAAGPLLWELEVARPLPVALLSDLRNRLDNAADTSDVQMAGWRQRATSDSARAAAAGLVATGQAERAELAADRQRFYLAVVETELARVQGGRSATSLWSALFGTSRPGTGQLALLETLQGRYPDSAQITYALGRARRVGGDLDGAGIGFENAVRLAPQAPEGYFGQGTVARARGDRQRAAELYALALQRDGTFFPSFVELAALDEEVGDYAAAVAERRALSQIRPGTAGTVALARTLRLSGPAGFAEAEQVLLPLASTDADAAVELARLYNDAGRTDAAVSAYLDALRIDPRSSVAAFELGETYVALENYAEAERYLSQAVRAAPANVDARLALANLYQGPLNDLRRADHEYAQALDTGVNDPVVLEQIGDAALAASNYGQAIEAFLQALAIGPDSAVYRFKLATAYFEAGRLGLATQQADAALALATDQALRAEVLTILGDTARLSGDLPGATGRYSEALQLNPGLIRAELGLGLVAVSQGNWGVASGYFQSAAAMPGGADDPIAQFWLGEALLRQRSYAAATTAYNRAVELQPKFPAAYLGLAQVQHAQGQGSPDAARTALETVGTAISQDVDYAEALLFQGKLLQELGRTNEAEGAYSASIRANGQIAETHFRRGIIEVQSGRYDAAVRDFRRAIALQPNFPEASYWLGRSYYAQGRNDLALQAFQQAVSLNGNFVDAIFYIGLVSEDLGRTAEAISAYQTVISLDPGGLLAGRARAQIDKLT